MFRIFLITFLSICLCGHALCQQTIFSLAKNDITLADEYFKDRNYQAALALYQSLFERDSKNYQLLLQTARCYYHLKQYDSTNRHYTAFLAKADTLPAYDRIIFAESLAASNDYKNAVSQYHSYLETNNDMYVMKKIWQLRNVTYLYEDSAHYSINRININGVFSEMSPIPYKDGLAFISNAKSVRAIEKTDAYTSGSLYTMYFAKRVSNTGIKGSPQKFGAIVRFDKSLKNSLHFGSFAFFNKGNKLVFAANSKDKNKNGSRTLQLFFTELKSGTWQKSQAFEHNHDMYSFTDPSITEDGKTLYFSSDMPGGFGGKDIYRSELINNQWTKPVNLGENINTPYDDVSPFYHSNSKTLYFSSNGHAGLGALDIFKVDLNFHRGEQVENLGYPLNSTFDDFAFYLDSAGNHGFLSSNRLYGGFNDDIYEFDIGLQTYPFVISGTIKYKESLITQASQAMNFANARLYLIDNYNGSVVFESLSDESGHFSLTIPYLSQYKLKVVGRDNDEHIVSFDIPKHKAQSYEHEVVILKEVFKSTETKLND